MKEMVSFELGKETEKDVFRLVTLVTLVTLLSQKHLSQEDCVPTTAIHS